MAEDRDKKYLTQFIAIYALMIAAIIYLSGCTNSQTSQHSTGGMTCFGYCALAVANSSIEVETDNEVSITTSKETGFISYRPTSKKVVTIKTPQDPDEADPEEESPQ